MFEKVIQRLVELPGWRHRGLVCFTELESRAVLWEHLTDITEEDMKVINLEMNSNFCLKRISGPKVLLDFKLAL